MGDSVHGFLGQRVSAVQTASLIPYNYSIPPHFRHCVSPVMSTWWVETDSFNLVDRLIVASASPWMANHPLSGVWSGQVNHLNFGGHHETIPVERFNLQSSNFAHW